MGNTISAMIGGDEPPPIPEWQVDAGWSKSKHKRKRRQEKKKRAKVIADHQAVRRQTSMAYRLTHTISAMIGRNANLPTQQSQVDEVWSKSKRKRKRQQANKKARRVADEGQSSIEQPLDSKKPFPFFKLPRELRDDIYGRLAQERHTKDLGRGFPCFPKGVFQVGSAANSIGLVSKQFKQEYEEELARQPGYRTLSLNVLRVHRDEGSWRWSRLWLSHQVHLRSELSRVTRLHIIFDDNALGLWLEMARNELQVLISCMPLVKTIEIEFRNVRRIYVIWRGLDLFTEYLLRCKDQLQRMLRDDEGKMIGDCNVQYSALLEHRMQYTTSLMLEGSWPEFASWVTKRQDQALVAAYLSSVHISFRARIFEDYSLDLEAINSEMIARLGKFMAEVMAGLRELQDSKTWRADFRTMWRKLIEQPLGDQRYRIWSREL